MPSSIATAGTGHGDYLAAGERQHRAHTTTEHDAAICALGHARSAAEGREWLDMLGLLTAPARRITT